MSDEITPEEMLFLKYAQEAARVIGCRSGEVTFRYKRGQLWTVRYNIPGQIASLREAISKLQEAGGHGEIVLQPQQDGGFSITVAVSKELPLSKTPPVAIE